MDCDQSPVLHGAGAVAPVVTVALVLLVPPHAISVATEKTRVKRRIALLRDEAFASAVPTARIASAAPDVHNTREPFLASLALTRSKP